MIGQLINQLFHFFNVIKADGIIYHSDSYIKRDFLTYIKVKVELKFDQNSLSTNVTLKLYDVFMT